MRKSIAAMLGVSVTFCLLGGLCVSAGRAYGQAEKGRQVSLSPRKSYSSVRMDSPEYKAFRKELLGLRDGGRIDEVGPLLAEASSDVNVHLDVRVFSWFGVGALKHSEGAHDEAIRAFQKCRELAEADPWRYEFFKARALRRIADVQARMGRYEEAAASYRRLLEEFPDTVEGESDVVADALERIQHCYKSWGRTDQFYEFCKELAERYPDKLAGAHAMLMLGLHEAEEAKKHWKVAVKYLKTVVETFGERPELSGRARYALTESLSVPPLRETCARCGRRIGGDWKYVVTLKDYTSRAFCSPHHGIPYQLEMGHAVASAQVFDFVTSQLTDAKGALYIVPKSGAGTLIAACAWRDQAERVAAKEGGRVLTYEELVEAIAAETKR